MTSQKTLLVDGHVHIYPNFDLTLAINAGQQNLLHAGNADIHDASLIQIWLLTERSDCHFFDEITNSHHSQDTRMTFEPTDESEAVRVRQDGQSMLFLLAGRQIVTCEGLEVNAVATRLFLKDRAYTTEETLARIVDSGGVAVLNWAPGKWFMARGKLVQKLIDHNLPKDFLIGDTYMRPAFWSTPRLMRQAQKRGFKIIAGSDPLPFVHEEEKIGRYGFTLSGAFNPGRPAESLRSLLMKSEVGLKRMGQRSGLIEFTKRQVKIMREKQMRT